MNRSEMLGIRVRPDLKVALEKEAAADDRSVSSLVERVLRTWLEQRGHQVGTSTTP